MLSCVHNPGLSLHSLIVNRVLLRSFEHNKHYIRFIIKNKQLIYIKKLTEDKLSVSPKFFNTIKAIVVTTWAYRFLSWRGLDVKKFLKTSITSNIPQLLSAIGNPIKQIKAYCDV